MTQQAVPPPLGDKLIITTRPQYQEGGIFEGQKDPQEGYASEKFADYLSSSATATERNIERVQAVITTGENSSIAATDLSGGGVDAGLYRLSYYATLSLAAGTSSSLQLTFTWTDDGISKSTSTTAYTGNSTGAPAAIGSFLLRVDSLTPITYATSYASVSAGVMHYTLAVTLEKVAA